MRLNFVSGRFPWSDAKEAVFDWILDDESFTHWKRYNLLSNSFNQIGVACSC